MADAVFAALTSGLPVKQSNQWKNVAGGGGEVRVVGNAVQQSNGPKEQVEANKRKHPDVTNPFADAPLDVVPTTGDPSEVLHAARKRHRIKVTGTAAPAPLRGFAELATRYHCNTLLLYNLAALQHTVPTPIQRQAIPALLDHRQVLAVAPTGSGKTLAFLIPMVASALPMQKRGGGDDDDGINSNGRGKQYRGKKQPQPVVGNGKHPCGLHGVVVSPTKELASQTARAMHRLVEHTGLRVCCLTKATSVGTEFDKVHLLSATPLLLDRLIAKGRVDLSTCRMLVLDEADRLFEGGFVKQVDVVLEAATHPELVRALFSATLPEAVEHSARSVLSDPLRITVGERNAATSAVHQRLVFVGQEKGRMLAMRTLIREGLTPPCLVFVSSKERAVELHRELMYDGGMRVDSIHADQPVAQRNAAVDNFRAGRTWVLIATDLLGRGIDFLGINTVVNYDMPATTTDYVHRIGRTGRGGRQGTAITLFVEQDAPRLRGIANLIRAAGSEVPEWILALPKQRKHKKKKKTRVDFIDE